MNRNKFLKSTVSYACMVLMVFGQLAFITSPGMAQKKAEAAPSAIIYDNGPLSTGATTKSAVAAPAGFTFSELSTDNSGGNFSNTTLGAGCQAVATTLNRCADDFTVPVGQTWTINSVIGYAYQTNATTNPFVSGTLRIWNGRPGDAGAAIIFGDTTTNRLGTVTDSTWLRIGNTLGGAGGVGAAAPNAARKIWNLPLNVSPAQVLTAGTYWIDFQYNAGANGNFTPLIAIPGARSLPGWNGRQFVSTTSTWGNLFDIGEPATTPTQTDVVPDVQMDFPFRLDGTVTGAAAVSASRFLDFDGDNKTDFTVVRSASATGQTTWFTWTSAGAEVNNEFGLGAGFSTGDKPVPADYNGDGRTDIAVWRASEGAFYILHSGTNTLRAELFGQAGDDPTVVGDYDGNGTDDLAVYRAGATGQQSNYYHRLAANGPTFTTPWGLGGDKAIPGDFDGDGKADFHVARNESGSYVHYELRSTAGFNAYPWGLSTDKIVTGDFDADGRTDIGAIRANGTIYDWYVLKSSNSSLLYYAWGNPATDILTPGDYDGDNKTDFAVWRSGQSAAQTQFYVIGSASASRVFKWGQSAGPLSAPDYPVANFTVK